MVKSSLTISAAFVLALTGAAHVQTWQLPSQPQQPAPCQYQPCIVTGPAGPPPRYLQPPRYSPPPPIGQVEPSTNGNSPPATQAHSTEVHTSILTESPARGSD